MAQEISYQQFVDEVNRFEFIEDIEMADAVVKAVLGIVASRMEEGPAREFIVKLPEPLTIQKLRGHQVNITEISAGQYIDEIMEMFDLNEDQAMEVIKRVWHVTKQAVGEEVMHDVEDALPFDWSLILESA